MFGKMMNNYYYGKSGKGDFRKEDLPQNRRQLFADTLKTRLSALCRINLLYTLIFLPAIIVTVIVSLIEMITISSTGPIGLLMNVLSTCAFVVPAALFYRSKRKFSSAVVGLILGIVCMAIIMVLWNWLITPLYMGVPRETVVGMLLPVFLPFNLIKGAINAAITLLLYHPIVSALRKANLVPQSTSKAPKKKGLSLGVTLVSIFVIISLVLVILAWTGII